MRYTTGMLILIHVCIAVASIVTTTALAFWPSRSKLYASYALIGLTLVSGTYLVISLHSPLLKSCVTGLAYLSIVTVVLYAGQRRLAMQRARVRSEE